MRRQPRALIAFVVGVQAIKLWLASVLPLFADEAFYLFEGRHFAAAYDDVPALVPWSLAAAEAWLGGSLLALRLPSLLLSWLALGLLWRIAREAWDAAAAWRCLLLASLPPILAMNGVLALPDVGIDVAVLLCLYGLQRAQRGAAGAGLLLAAGLALGWWSHYRFLLPLAAAALWLLLDRTSRPLLREAPVLRGALLGLALGLAPLVWHGLQAAGGGFVFQFHARHPWQFQPQVLFDPLLQAIAVGPVLYLMLLVEGVRRVRGATGLPRLAAGLGLALVLLIWLLGPWVDSERSRLHWPVPAYLALALPLAAAWPSWGRGWRWAALLPGVLLCAGGAAYLAVAALAPDRLAGTRLYPHNFAGWPEIAAEVDAALRGLPAGTVVVADHAVLAAQLDRHLRPHHRVHALDHPLNHKHGRAAELARWQRDEAALAALPAGPRLLVIELSASRLRERAAWLQRICQHFPDARHHAERLLGRGEKRLLLLSDLGPRAGVCAPGVLGYLELPGSGAARPGDHIEGWALAVGTGVQAVRLRIGDRLVPLDYGIPLPSLAQDLGDTGDPGFPQVGFRGSLPPGLPAGRQWVWLQARTGARDWHDVLAQPVDLAAE